MVGVKVTVGEKVEVAVWEPVGVQVGEKVIVGDCVQKTGERGL